MATQARTAQISNPPQSSSKYRQAVINGNFDIWQRATSFSTQGATADRWICTLTSGSLTVTQEAFTLGQTDVPHEPVYFHRFVSGNTSNIDSRMSTNIENVRTFAGRSCTLSYWAKCASGTLSVTPIMRQNFGSGGSANVDTSGSADTVTTSWQQFTQTFTMPSISGKTLGAGNYIRITFDLPENTAFTFDLAQVQLSEGTELLPFQPKSRGQELQDCLRYLEVIGGNNFVARDRFAVGYATSTINVQCIYPYKVIKRDAPTLTFPTGVVGDNDYSLHGFGGVGVFADNSTFSSVVSGPTTLYFSVDAVASSFTAGNAGFVDVRGVDAPIICDAEM